MVEMMSGLGYQPIRGFRDGMAWAVWIREKNALLSRLEAMEELGQHLEWRCALSSPTTEGSNSVSSQSWGE
eukprot:CAMPEP_0181106734 /NCGR_PEP_ID=MMETSP1071-20121207/16686_1 /TAXON_ID=35127 /ORGANISM="Thalassiosira sp., Strain NH16" /LENGTH=70 /DNA_ID=CAMNT_0023190153 /DNA_START=8 /DNA_END=220 /DNA_ORIENTATION=+